MRRERIVPPSHFLDGCIHLAHGVAECREGILQANRAHLRKRYPGDTALRLRRVALNDRLTKQGQEKSAGHAATHDRRERPEEENTHETKSDRYSKLSRRI